MDQQPRVGSKLEHVRVIKCVTSRMEHCFIGTYDQVGYKKEANKGLKVFQQYLF